ncbi:MAG TPA: DNA-binding response regulator, partial [Cellulomonas sp.]
MIVDDHEVVRRGIAEVVERADGMKVVAEAGSVADG